MNRKNQYNSGALFTKMIVFGAILLLVGLLVLVAIGIASNRDPSVPSDDTTDPPETTKAPETTNPPDTTKPPVTTIPPVTTNPPITTRPPETTIPPETTRPPETTIPPETTGVTPGTKYPNTIVNWQKFENSTATLKETADAGQEYINKIVFLGDSTTNGLRAYGVLADGINTKQVWTGAVSNTLTLDNTIMNKMIFYPDLGKEMTIIEAVKHKQPEIMVITLGVNGISFSSETQFKTNYTNLVLGIREASPNTKIILQSIFPVTKAYDDDPATRIKNEKIRAANEWILSIAETYGFKFLNTTSILQDTTGSLIEKYCNDAKLHLNETGLVTELQYIRTHAYN